MANAVNTSVDYNKLESAKSQINEILTEMMETSSEIGKIINSISALDDAGIDPAAQYGGYSNPNYSAEHGHDGCFNELPSELENLQTSLNGGYLYNKTDTLYQTTRSAIECFTDSEGKSINGESWGSFVSGLPSTYKPESIKEGDNVEWTFHYTAEDFEKNMTEEERALFEATKAEIASLATSVTGAEDESGKTGATAIGSAVSLVLEGAQLPIALAYLATMEQPVGPLSNEGYREALAKALKEKYPTMSDETINKAIDTYIDSKQKSSSDVNTETGGDDGSDTGDDGNGDNNNNGGGGGGTPPNNNEIQYRKENPTPEPNNTPQRQDTPTPKPEEKPSTTPEETPVKEDEKEPTIIEDEEKVPETPSEEKPSTTPEPETPPSNNNSNNNQTNTGGNSNNSGAVNNTPSTGGNTNNGNNNYYAPSNNGGGNYNGGGSSNAPATGAGTPNENASTTTPSAPESDAGINDNSGETLDVISIDKDGGKSSASTSSNDGGSVVPTILGVGVAGAAAVAGAKILHDKKKKENEYIYEEDGSTESDNSFANLESYTGDDTVDTTDTMSPGKYRAGSANNLVLEGSPSDIKIDESIADIPNQKEELE